MTATRRSALWALIGVASGAVIGVVIIAAVVAAVMAAQIRGDQVDNTKTIDNTAAAVQNTQDTLDLIRDCTEPAGQCFRRGQERTAAAVDDIGLLSAYAAACADQPNTQTADEIQACVLDLLDRTSPKR